MEILLPIHTSPETAYVVDDYPYGFRLRCKIRYWLEWNKNGVRFCSQTTNPKRAFEVWNKPKKSTYSDLMVLWLNDINHLECSGKSTTWGDQIDLDKWLDTWRDGLPDSEQVHKTLKQAAIAYEARKYVKFTIGARNSDQEPQTKEERAKILKSAYSAGAVDFIRDGGIL